MHLLLESVCIDSHFVQLGTCASMRGISVVSQRKTTTTSVAFQSHPWESELYQNSHDCDDYAAPTPFHVFLLFAIVSKTSTFTVQVNIPPITTLPGDSPT
jgi:hypothetical protein